MTKFESLINKTVLVTGAGRGIGRGIALAFGAQGSTVLVNDLSEEHCVETVGAIVSAGGTAQAAPADVAERAQAEALIHRVVDQHGRLDVLINNAGINPVAPFLELSQEVWERIQRVNLWALFHLGQPAARHMVEHGGGSIVVIASPAAEETYSGQTHYATTKAGLQMLAWGMAWELGPRGVRTNVVHPGWIETELNRQYLWSDPSLREQVVSVIPLRRTGTPEDVGRAVVWLCSDEAGYVNGASLRVDGGLVVGRPKT